MDQLAGKPKVTPKDFFLWAGAMVALYWSVGSLIALLFSYIDYAYPDTLSYADPYSTSTRFAMASLIVLAPTFLVLMRLIRADIQRHAEKFNLWVRRWALYFTLFVAGISIVIDLITLINTYLNGDVTTRFIFKVVIVLLIASGFFMHFLADIWGYWKLFPKRASYVNYGAGVVVVLVIVAGFYITGSPNTARLLRFDDQRVNDLTNMQYQVTNYWQAKQKLPASIADLSDPLTGAVVPTDPETGTPYHYEAVGANSFKLCAVFSKESRAGNGGVPASVTYPAKGQTPQDSWMHGVGEVCFTRTIDPAFYPPYNKAIN
jgi:hypothetical protein